MKNIIVMLAVTALLVVCNMNESHKDVSAASWAREVIGTRYEVIGEVYGYGVRPHSRAPVEYVLLTAPPGIAGPEVAWKEPVRKGSIVTVRKVLQSNRFFEHDIDLEVDLEGTPLPVAARSRIKLVRDNKGSGYVALNPAIYRRLAPRSDASRLTAPRAGQTRGTAAT